MGAQLPLSQTNIFSQSEIKWGRSWKYVLQHESHAELIPVQRRHVED